MQHNNPTRLTSNRSATTRLIGAATVFLIALLLFSLVAIPAQGATSLLALSSTLQNPGFEGTYVSYNGDSSRMVASGWTPWNVSPAANDPSYVNQTPAYQAATKSPRVHGGSAAQEFYVLYATFDAGLLQQMSIPAGSYAHFSVYASVWSGTDDEGRSINPGGLTVQVGIDPNGGTDVTASAISWSQPIEAYDQFKQLAIDAATPVGPKGLVTVFVRGKVKNPVKHNHVFVDDAAFSFTAPTAVPASKTPIPSSTSTTAPKTATPIPPTNTAVPSITPIPPTVDNSGFATPTREGTIPATITPGGATLTPFPSDTPSPVVNTPVGSGGNNNPTPTGTVVPTGGVGFIYTVKSGDTLYDLAIRFGTTVDAILASNQIGDGSLIYVDEQLTIPVVLTPTPAPTNVPSLPTLPPPAVLPTLLPAVVPLNGPTYNGIGTYIVQTGDTLASIARLYNITPGALAGLNGIVNAAQVQPGRVLVVPGPGNNIGGRAPTPTPRHVYVVQVGDNLFRISLKFHITLAALMSANGIVNPNLVYAGQQLTIPG